jgi:hypothetical protein
MVQPRERKSKFGLRQAIELIELYCMTKSEGRRKEVPWYGREFDSLPYQRGRFLKKVLIFEKKGGCRFFFRVCMVGCMGRISHTNLKIRMVISRIAISKNHIELHVLVPGQI